MSVITKTDLINQIVELKPDFKSKISVLYSNSIADLKKELSGLKKAKNMSNNETIKTLVEKFGDKQVVVAIEELSELQKELCKHLRGKTNVDNITEEMADVHIMLSQMQILFKIDNATLSNEINKKIERTKERLL